MAKKWNELSVDEKDVWRRKAVNIIYPDLRKPYSKGKNMIDKLQKTLYKIYVMSLEGGGEYQPTTTYIPSVLDNKE